ncbi:signal recognition particle-docking protein FtsY [Planktothrix paucivesiculata]|uniref:Signal recognition particle receptor FtsY n=1 Tax=Planktothrix paucivesiculata PCC 9631 TaxID=671071 RepID=A0A7Z9BTC6_9CYAN|nr:signal recognition particle-docking protein FtsY [Planktothrix paucivesiculata]VXD22360.1 Signal recognition particle receptor FtsY [Planktothrix paucivesiculata PCC 9631]
MVFNWFRRQFNEKTDQNQEPETEVKSEPVKVDKPAETADSSEEKPQISEDYLQWAKAAYKNIQKQQQPEPEVEPEVEPTVLTDETPEVETAVETPVEAIEIEETEPELEPETDLPDTETPPASPAPPAPPAATEPVEVPPAPPTPPAPFWAASTTERQTRLERLKETAIEPEPETSETASGEAGMVFDEVFMWSAQVLADQGRRPDQVALEEITWLQKLWKALGRTRRNLLNQLKAIVGQGPLNQQAVDEIESMLLQADVGVAATDRVIEALQSKLRQEALPPEQAIAYLKQILRGILEEPFSQGYPISFAPEKDTLNIWLVTGVNGAGKTTTIGKIAHLAQKSGYRCLIAAGDTFRAAAVDQVKVWGERTGVEVVANPGKNTDPAAVVYDAIEAARSRNTELLIIDTAGRLQNKKNLMEELNKIRRVIDKRAPSAKIQSLLVLDSTLGQNGLRQAEVFSEVAQLSGVVLTKLDGTAKGGVALAIVQQLGLPIRFIGVGESIEDLRPFSSYEFIEALLSG